ncbi:excalibur calcium-binding domain-containing protein [Actinomyces wuliandei]|uniref:excalibur calcium-binding domain-containing protein n=1 Tax=Actinomyces wuliandei TaxID=2057743 RepID=UPI001FAB2CC4|nr:excalibur calcium-binding domain-containing protein [Actinomyces wuliandei]
MLAALVLVLCLGAVGSCDDGQADSLDPPPASGHEAPTSAPATASPLPTVAATPTATVDPPATTTQEPGTPAPETSPAPPEPPQPEPEAPAEPVPPEAPAEPPRSDVYYENCQEARDAGATPIYQGDPGYRDRLDRDKDGVACE